MTLRTEIRRALSDAHARTYVGPCAIVAHPETVREWRMDKDLAPAFNPDATTLLGHPLIQSWYVPEDGFFFVLTHADLGRLAVAEQGRRLAEEYMKEEKT